MSDLRCFVVEITCRDCRVRLRRQMPRNALDKLVRDSRCPECGARVSVISILGTAAQATDWERVRAPEDAVTWKDLQAAGIGHCD